MKKETNDINEIKVSFNVSFIPSIEGKRPFYYIEKEIRLVSKVTELYIYEV